MILKFGLCIANLVHVREDSREVGKATQLVFKKDILIAGIISFFMFFFSEGYLLKYS